MNFWHFDRLSSQKFMNSDVQIQQGELFPIVILGEMGKCPSCKADVLSQPLIFFSSPVARMLARTAFYGIRI